MKKILLAIAVLASVSIVSCSKADKAANDEASDFKAKIENCTNPDSIALYVDQAQAYAQKLVNEGKVEEAKKYLADIQPIVEEKAPTLVGAFNTVKDFVDKIPANADSLKNVAVDSIKNAGAAAVENAKEAAQQATDEAVNKANEAVDNAKTAATDAANQAVDNAKSKAKDAADKATDAAKDKINNLLK